MAKRTLSIAACSFICISTCTNALGWGDKGHATVVAIALNGQPNLAARLSAALSHVSESSKLQQLIQATRNAETRMTDTKKQSAERLIASVQSAQFFGPDKIANAGTWPDHIRSLSGYNGRRYNKNHYVNLDFGGPQHDAANFAVTTNATIFLEKYEKDVTSSTVTAGDKAWDLFWICHLVGDLHQPLHSTARLLEDGDRDQGGNLIDYGKGTLHHFWDALPDKAGMSAEDYAASLLSGTLPSENLVKKLDPRVWAKEARETIRFIGYPSDFPHDANSSVFNPPTDVNDPISDYDSAALAAAEKKLVLGGLRLRKILMKMLPGPA